MLMDLLLCLLIFTYYKQSLQRKDKVGIMDVTINMHHKFFKLMKNYEDHEKTKSKSKIKRKLASH